MTCTILILLSTLVCFSTLFCNHITTPGILIRQNSKCYTDVGLITFDVMTEKFYVLLGATKLTWKFNLFDIKNGCNRYRIEYNSSEQILNITKTYSNNISYPVLSVISTMNRVKLIANYNTEEECILLSIRDYTLNNGIHILKFDICCKDKTNEIIFISDTSDLCTDKCCNNSLMYKCIYELFKIRKSFRYVRDFNTGCTYKGTISYENKIFQPSYDAGENEDWVEKGCEKYSRLKNQKYIVTSYSFAMGMIFLFVIYVVNCVYF